MSLLIKNGLIFDGRGQPPYEKDILVRGNTIAHIGDLRRYKADNVIDAKGHVIIPGFIDVNAATDLHLHLLEDRYQTRSLVQGITSVVGGNEGTSLAPLRDGSLRSFALWGTPQAHNINWGNLQDFFKVLDARKLGLNFGTLIGFETLKTFVVGDSSRDATEHEQKEMQQTLAEALNEGVFGLSVAPGGFNTHHIHTQEFRTLAEVVAATHRVYSTTLRDPDAEPLTSFEELRDLAHTTEVKLHINHCMPRTSAPSEYKTIREALEAQNTISHKIYINCHSYEISKIPIYQFLPPWIYKENLEDMVRIVQSKQAEEDIIEHLKQATRKEIRIGYVPSHLLFLQGSTIKAFAEERGTSQAEALLALMRLSSLQAVCTYDNINKQMLGSYLQSPQTVIASDGIHLMSPSYEPFTAFLTWATQEHDMSFEKALIKTTSLPARLFGIAERGEIREHYHADLLIVKDTRIRDVIVNGVHAVQDGVPQATLSGAILRAQQ